MDINPEIVCSIIFKARMLNAQTEENDPNSEAEMTDEQRDTLLETSSADIVLIATPFDLSKHLELTKKSVRVYYDYADVGEPTLGSVIDEFVEKKNINRR